MFIDEGVKMEINEFHINNILKDMEKKEYQGYLLAQFTNIHYISNYRPTSFAFCVIKEVSNYLCIKNGYGDS